ncbi:MAG: hypothetical protein U9N77_16255, partial [Thermodesulfobacteriota bacterium]|nr:hypothetical protein [Thermodesulfobacteriota bacterium]
MDTPQDYIAFREAIINMLIHQDYADHSRKPAITHFNDSTRFWNPGDASAHVKDLLEPGDEVHDEVHDEVYDEVHDDLTKTEFQILNHCEYSH